MAIIRFLVAAVAATALTFGMLVIGLALHGAFNEEEQLAHEFTEVELISRADRYDVKELLAEREKETVRDAPEPAPPPSLPPREVSGFVQVEFTVRADGSVEDARVVGAAPSGHYEEQALEEIRGQRFEPRSEGGEALPTRRTEIVEFTVTAEAPPTEGDVGGDGSE